MVRGKKSRTMKKKQGLRFKEKKKRGTGRKAPKAKKEHGAGSKGKRFIVFFKHLYFYTIRESTICLS